MSAPRTRPRSFREGWGFNNFDQLGWYTAFNALALIKNLILLFLIGYFV